MPTMKEVVAGITTTLQNNAAKNKGVNGVFQFDITGDDPMTFYFKLDDGVPSVAEGTADSPSITISMAAPDFKDMIDGKLNGTMAFMSGKLKLKGDMGLAMKLESLLK
ncbi:MAG: SCP2 sterol-binding domain-containing protein [Peptococcaceae bacterium]|nr:SCP2 sterol-binding domain-containing protein [Peptococcaceae bacterium]